MKPIILHPYQQQLKSEIYQDWNAGKRNVCAVLPTGGGKSVVVSDIVLDCFRMNMRQGVIAHRNELVTQMSSHIARRGIPHRIIGSDKTISQAVRKHRKEFGQSFIHPTAPTCVIGVDTMMARKDSLGDWAKQLDQWIIDESHHVVGNENVDRNKWGAAVEMFSNARGLGVTATPVRADGKGLGREYDGVFDSMVTGPSMRWLIQNDFLADYDIACPTSDLKVSEDDVSADGDWSSKTLRKAAKKSHIVGDVVTNYCIFAYGRKAIVFATDVETANEIGEKFKTYGIKAAALSAQTDSTVREKYIEEFAQGDLKVLINVDLFDEGFDVPACDVVILARPTASLGKYMQMCGRALRYQIGKIALIIDMVSNIIRHGLPDKDRIWSLMRKEKRAKQNKDPDEIPLVKCRNCTKPYEQFRTVCPYCSYEKPLPDPRSRSVESVDGDLVLLTREVLEKMRQATILESAADVANRVGKAAGAIAAAGASKRQIEKIVAHGELVEALAQWGGIQRSRGYSDSEIYRKFYITMGFDMLSALDASKTRVEIEEITKTVEGWYK